MERINLVVFWVLGSLCMMVSLPLCAQQQNGCKGQMDSIYRCVVLTSDMQDNVSKIDEANRKAEQVIMSISGDNERKKARWVQYKCILESVGARVYDLRDSLSRRVLNEYLVNLDTDAPDLELLDSPDIVKLLDVYFDFYMPDLRGLDRITRVLYTVKSEKVRAAYTLTMLKSFLMECGYDRSVDNILEDIQLCSKEESTLTEVRRVRDQYYRVRKEAVAPEFEMSDVKGNVVKLSDYRGKMVFMAVWQTGCDSCQYELPYFMKMAQEYKHVKDLVFLTVFTGGHDEKAEWVQFLKDRKYSDKMTHLIAGEKQENGFNEVYCITRLPRYILISKEGVIVDAWHFTVKHPMFKFGFDYELNQWNK